MKLGEAMYKASQEESAAANDVGNENVDGSNGDAKADDVVDVDFEEVDEKSDEKEKKAGS